MAMPRERIITQVWTAPGPYYKLRPAKRQGYAMQKEFVACKVRETDNKSWALFHRRSGLQITGEYRYATHLQELLKMVMRYTKPRDWAFEIEDTDTRALRVVFQDDIGGAQMYELFDMAELTLNQAVTPRPTIKITPERAKALLTRMEAQRESSTTR